MQCFQTIFELRLSEKKNPPQLTTKLKCHQEIIVSIVYVVAGFGVVHPGVVMFGVGTPGVVGTGVVGPAIKESLFRSENQ